MRDAQIRALVVLKIVLVCYVLNTWMQTAFSFSFALHLNQNKPVPCAAAQLCSS